jgi:hypothetical protein
MPPGRIWQTCEAQEIKSNGPEQRSFDERLNRTDFDSIRPWNSSLPPAVDQKATSGYSAGM